MTKLDEIRWNDRDFRWKCVLILKVVVALCASVYLLEKSTQIHIVDNGAINNANGEIRGYTTADKIHREQTS